MVTRRGRRAEAPTTEATLPESENTDVSVDTVPDAGTENTEALNVDETLNVDGSAGVVAPEADATVKPKRSYARPTEAIEARRRLSEYKRAEEARTMLIGLGFTVEAPDSWEHPDKVNERERARKALAAYLAAGGSVSDLTGATSEDAAE